MILFVSYIDSFELSVGMLTVPDGVMFQDPKKKATELSNWESDLKRREKVGFTVQGDKLSPLQFFFVLD